MKQAILQALPWAWALLFAFCWLTVHRLTKQGYPELSRGMAFLTGVSAAFAFVTWVWG